MPEAIKPPRVGIIMPAFNAAPFIKEAIASVRAQTIEEWELIVVDDGSTDDTAQIVASLGAADKRIQLIRQPNGGQARARNTAIHATEAPWLAFLDADDLWQPEKLESQLHAALEHGADLVFCGGLIFEHDLAQPLGHYPACQGLFEGADMARLLFRANPIQNSSVLVRRERLEIVGLLDEDRELQNAEDFDLWFRLALSGARFLGMRESLSHYRRHPSSSTALLSRMHRPELEVLRRHWKTCGVGRPVAKKKIRAVARALVGELVEQGAHDEARRTLNNMAQEWDRFGPLTLYQRVILRCVPRAFNVLMRPIYALGDVLKGRR